MIQDKIQVLITLPAFKLGFGGVSSYLLSLMRNISDDTVSILGRDKYLSNAERLRRRSKFDNFMNKLKMMLFLLSFPFLLITKKVDVVHSNPSIRTMALLRDGYCVVVSKLFKKKVLMFIHGWNVDLINTIKSNMVCRKIFCWMTNKADVVAVLCNEFKDELEQLGVTASIVTETTMVDQVFIESFCSENEIKSKFKDNHQNILFMSRMVKDKGVYEAVDTFYRLQKKYPGVKLILGGDGPELKSLKEYVNSLRISNKVSFLGYISGDDKINAFKNASIFFFPTRYGEGMPIVVLEAMSSGLPIITRSVAGLKDLFDTGVKGYITESTDPKLFEHMIEELFNTKGLAEDMGFSNYLYAREHLSASKVSARIENIYKDLSNI